MIFQKANVEKHVAYYFGDPEMLKYILDNSDLKLSGYFGNPESDRITYQHSKITEFLENIKLITD